MMLQMADLHGIYARMAQMDAEIHQAEEEVESQRSTTTAAKIRVTELQLTKKTQAAVVSALMGAVTCAHSSPPGSPLKGR